MSEPNKTLWVRSKWNPQATDKEKWLVAKDFPDAYVVPSKNNGASLHLPKSDYVPCEAPVQYEKLEVKLDEHCPRKIYIVHKHESIGHIEFPFDGYRVVSLVVERRKT
ncbi:MAG: hypothetical protein KGL39_18640 [Patescibacteria group bacterium]|nr:hypothetical protein [Patescibacteria group bacterium]